MDVMRLSLAAILFVSVSLTGCIGEDDDDGDGNGDTSPYGTYIVERTITTWEPSPDFQIALSQSIDLVDNGNVTVSTAESISTFEVSGTHVQFMTSESWPSPEGTAAVTLWYDLVVPGDDTLTGTATAKVIFDTEQVFADFDFAFSVDGQRAR